jgi:hypothetical protein
LKFLYILIIFFSFSLKIFACECNVPSTVEEFTTSDYVFEGIVVSKKYSKDYLTYKITFKILKHYKNGNNPKNLSFVLTSESRYTKNVTSCNWDVNINEKWLVYVNKSSDGELYFSKYCSNSQQINSPLYYRYQRWLDNVKKLKLDDFIYDNEFRTNFSVSYSPVDSIFKNGLKKEYDDKYIGLYLLIDKEGNLKSANMQNQLIPIYDSIYNLKKDIQIVPTIQISEFAKDAIELILNVKKWEIRRIPVSKIPISYIQFIGIYYEANEKKWKYELR